MFLVPPAGLRSPQDGPKAVKMAEDDAKTAPRRSQDGLEGFFSACKNRLRFCLVFGSIWAPFWLPKCSLLGTLCPPLGTLLATKIHQKNNQKIDCSKCRLQIASRPPKTSQGPPQERPKIPQDHPKITQELPKALKNAPKMVQVFPRTLKKQRRRHLGTASPDVLPCLPPRGLIQERLTKTYEHIFKNPQISWRTSPPN